MEALMATTTLTHWRDRAIEKSVIITDAWEVTKSYAGRVAEWVLFLCMVVNIVEILPGVELPTLASNIVLGVQVVMLDVGGFSLASMADHARRMGDEKAARRASVTGWFLIILMMVTLLLVAVAVLFPETKDFIANLEKALILVRVVMTVAYGHVIHSLRSQGHAQAATAQADLLQEATEQFNQQLQGITEGWTKREQQLIDKLTEITTTAKEKEQHFLAQITEMQAHFSTQISTLQTTLDEVKSAATSAEIPTLETTQESALDEEENGGESADLSAEFERTNITLLRPENRTRIRTKNRTASTSATASQKAAAAQRIIRKNAHIKPAQLAEKAGISETYARKLLADYRAQSEAVNE
jgi:hypothetical protein